MERSRYYLVDLGVKATLLAKTEGSQGFVWLKLERRWERDDWALGCASELEGGEEVAEITAEEARKLTGETARYYLIGVPPDVLAKREPSAAYVWRGGEWQRSDWAYNETFGDRAHPAAHEIGSEQARHIMEQEPGTP